MFFSSPSIKTLTLNKEIDIVDILIAGVITTTGAMNFN